VLGSDVRRYPALVDRKQAVDLTLLESAAAAEASSRRGLERLLWLAAQKPLGALAKRAPAPFPRRDGLPPTRAEVEVFREAVLGRTLREAFSIGSTTPLPRTRAAFETLYAAGLPRLEDAFSRLARALGIAAAELDKTERALRAAASQPSGTHAARDIRAQLELLFPADLLESIELERLEQLPRYLRAAQTRLARAIVDPRKDADKLEPFSPLWKAFLEKRALARDTDAATALRWAFEELRVALFAPELKPSGAVSVASVSRALAALA
jgi:ATP-dependent helicase HrpA